MAEDTSMKLLGIMRGLQAPGVTGLKVVRVDATDPNPVTFVFEGTQLAIDIDIFEVPISAYPLRKGDRFLAFPLIGEGASQRWGLVEKLTGGVVLATMQSATSLKIDGITKTYVAADLVIPPYFAVSDSAAQYETSALFLVKAAVRPLQNGDKVSIAPTWDEAAKKVKYVILERY